MNINEKPVLQVKNLTVRYGEDNLYFIVIMWEKISI